MQPSERVHVFDAVLPDAVAYRALALAQPFADVAIGAATFHGIAAAPDQSVLDRLSELVGEVGPVTTFLRRSPAGQPEPNFIHTDMDMGAWTGILYLTESPAAGDGTTFWRERESGAVESDSTAMTEGLDWQNRQRFEPWQTVPALFNRLVLFPAAFYHSRALFWNYGETPEEARLIQVMFGGTHVCRH